MVNSYKIAQRLRSIATRLEKIIALVRSVLPSNAVESIAAPIQYEINSLRALADEIRPKEK